MGRHLDKQITGETLVIWVIEMINLRILSYKLNYIISFNIMKQIV